MKKTLLTLFTGLLLFISFPSAHAQGWIQDRNSMYSLGVGGTQALFLPFQNYGLGDRGSLAASLNIAGEYKIQRFIGIGWQTGLDIFGNGYYYHLGPDGNYHYYSAAVVGVPIGVKLNFHILEAANAQIRDRLDLYAGINFGGGPAFYTGPGGGVYGFLYGGPQIGIRYWFDKVALFGELGWGATFANIGLTFR